MTLTEFLLARIAEDEATARAVPPSRFDDEPFSRRFSTWESDHTKADDAFLDKMSPARVLAECEAKRQIVELHKNRHYCHLDGEPGVDAQPYDDDNCDTLTLLAAAYSDHPDYRDEWRA